MVLSLEIKRQKMSSLFCCLEFSQSLISCKFLVIVSIIISLQFEHFYAKFVSLRQFTNYLIHAVFVIL